MGNKIKVLLPITLIMAIAMVGMVLGVATFQTPTAGSSITGAGARFNVTTTLINTTNATITCTSSLSGESFSLNVTNATGTLLEANGTVDTTESGDAADYSCSGTAYNSSTTEAVTAITVTVDNQVPNVGSCRQNSVAATNTTATVNTNTVDCLIYNATTCSVYWQDSTARGANSDTSTTSCTYTTTSSYASAGTRATCTTHFLSDKGDRWYFSCGDGTNTSVSSHYKLTLEGLSSRQIIAKKEAQDRAISTSVSGGQKNTQILFYAVAGAAALVIFGGFYVIRKKHK